MSESDKELLPLKDVPALADETVVELARRFGPSFVLFLRRVAENQWKELGLDKPVALQYRLSAVDIARKLMSLPTNVSLSVDRPPIFVLTPPVIDAKVLPDATNE